MASSSRPAFSNSTVQPGSSGQPDDTVSPHGVDDTPLVRLALRGAAAGALAGLIGGIPFGVMMALMGMLPMVAALIGSSSVIVGMGVHLVISTLIGAPFGGTVVFLSDNKWKIFGLGMANGVLWWGLGALVLMPLGLGMPEKLLSVGAPQMMSLAGHLVFGLVSGIAFHRIWQ